MKLLIFGATGACGRWIVRLALDRGHEVTAVVRPESAARAPSGVAVAIGQVLDRDFVRSIVSGQRTVISALGLRRAGLSPWARLQSPPDLVTRAMKNLVDSVEGESRIVWISAGGVAESRAMASRAVRLLTRTGTVGIAYRDLELAEGVMAASKVDSIAVRPVTLYRGSPTGAAGEVARYGLLSTIRRGDVAEWMVNVADGTIAFGRGSILLGRAR